GDGCFGTVLFGDGLCLSGFFCLRSLFGGLFLLGALRGLGLALLFGFDGFLFFFLLGLGDGFDAGVVLGVFLFSFRALLFGSDLFFGSAFFFGESGLFGLGAFGGEAFFFFDLLGFCGGAFFSFGANAFFGFGLRLFPRLLGGFGFGGGFLGIDGGVG